MSELGRCLRHNTMFDKEEPCWACITEFGDKKLQSDLAAEKRRAEGLAKALELLVLNKTEDCNVYTMGCDCDDVAKEALAAYRGEVDGL